MSEKRDDEKIIGGKYGQWCRTKGHPPSCNCEYLRTDPRNATRV